MPQYLKNAGVWRQCILSFKQAGVWHTAQGSLKTSGVYHNFGEAFSVTGNASAFGFCSNGQLNTSPCTATTSSAGVTGHGGSGSYTYSWAYVSGDTATVTTPSSGSTTFSRSAAGNNQQHFGVYRCTVTDTGLGQVLTFDVSVGTEHDNNN